MMVVSQVVPTAPKWKRTVILSLVEKLGHEILERRFGLEQRLELTLLGVTISPPGRGATEKRRTRTRLDIVLKQRERERLGVPRKERARLFDGAVLGVCAQLDERAKVVIPLRELVRLLDLADRHCRSGSVRSMPNEVR